jgi:hypothetical protein
MRQWGDKIVLLSLIFFFALFAMHGWHHGNADEAAFSSDLVKQLVSAILTLLVAARMPWGKPPGGTNGTTTVGNGSTTPASPVK